MTVQEFSPPLYRGVLLDIDGTLIDSNDAHAHAWVDALGEAKIVTNFDEIRPFIGMGRDKILDQIAKLDHESAEGNRISVRRGDIFRERYLPQLQAFPGAFDLLCALEAQGFKLAVATSASEEDLEALLTQTGLNEVIPQTRTSADDAEHSKPDPDIIEAALKKIGIPAENVIMLGDTPYDIEAANHAHVHTVAFRCGGHWADKDFSGATAIYDGPRALLERLESSALMMAR